MADGGYIYATLVGGEPICSRCGSDDVLIRTSDGALTDKVTMDDGGRALCRNCVTYPEELAQGRRLIEELEAEADQIRKRWLGDDCRTLSYKKLERRARKRGPAPDELTRIVDRLCELEEIVESMEYIVDSDKRLAHHALTGEWPDESREASS